MSALSIVPGSGENILQRDARYQALLDSDSTGVYTCDAAGIITYYNQTGCGPLGTYARSRGHRRAVLRFTHAVPRGRQLSCLTISVRWQTCLRVRSQGIYDAEVHVERPDGSRIVVIVNIAPLVDDNGAIVGCRQQFLRESATQVQEVTRVSFWEPCPVRPAIEMWRAFSLGDNGLRRQSLTGRARWVGYTRQLVPI